MARTLLIFDVDGTLVNSERMILAAQAEAFAAAGLEAPGRERALSIVGLSLREAFTELAGAAGPIEALTAHYRDAFFRLRQSGAIAQPLFEGAAALIAELHADPAFLLGIATGKSRRGVDAMLEKQGWHGVFATIQTADDAPSKPDPAMIRMACAEAGVAPGAAIMIGDSSFDMVMARAAGARAIGVAWGFQPRERLVAAGAEVIVEDFPGLMREIRAMAG